MGGELKPGFRSEEREEVGWVGWRVGAAEGVGGAMGCGGVEMVGGEDVAMTRNVVRSKRTTSVAPHASARVVRCLERTEALGIRVWTIRDHAYSGDADRMTFSNGQRRCAMQDKLTL